MGEMIRLSILRGFWNLSLSAKVGQGARGKGQRAKVKISMKSFFYILHSTLPSQKRFRAIPCSIDWVIMVQLNVQ